MGSFSDCALAYVWSRLSVRPAVFVCLSIHLRVRPSIRLFACPSACLLWGSGSVSVCPLVTAAHPGYKSCPRHVLELSWAPSGGSGIQLPSHLCPGPDDNTAESQESSDAGRGNNRPMQTLSVPCRRVPKDRRSTWSFLALVWHLQISIQRPSVAPAPALARAPIGGWVPLRPNPTPMARSPT